MRNEESDLDGGPTFRVGYFPYRPGLNPYQSLFAAALERQGVQVDRIAPMKLLPLQRVARASVDLFQFDWPHDWYNGRNVLTRSFKTVQYILGLSHFSRRRLVWTAHNLKRHDAVDARHEHQMIQRLVDRCDGIIVMSRAAGELLRETYRVADTTRVAIIPHGHFMDAYPNAVSREQARHRLSIPSDARVVLSFGRISPYKGSVELVRAFARVARRGDILLIAGAVEDEPFVDRLRQAVGELTPSGSEIRIHAEPIEPDMVQFYMNACDVVALPFRDILNSGSLMLAMSFGKCIVAPPTGSIPEVVELAGWFSFDPAQIGSLDLALRQSLDCSDRSARESLILDSTRSRYGWDHIGTATRDLYCSLLR